MSRKVKVLLVTEADSNVDFLERGITSRYKLLDRGRTYSIENAFKKIEEEGPDVVGVDEETLGKEREALRRKWEDEW